MAEDRGATWRWGLPLATAVAVLTGIADIGGAFVLDDPVAIEQSVCVTGDLDLAGIFASNFWCEQGGWASIQSWRPLTVLLWWGLWHAWSSTIPFTLVAVGLHVLSTLGVFHLGRELGVSERGATIGALLFAPLAIHVDAIAPAVGHAELLAAAGATWATIGYLRGRWWCIVLGLAAVLAKESGVLAFAFVATVAVVHPDDDRFGTRARAWLVVAALGAGTFAILAARASVLGAWTGTQIPAFVNPLVDVGIGERLLSGLGLIGRYHRLTLAGGPLAADYAHAAIGTGDQTPWVDVIMGACAVGLWGFAGWLGRERPAIRVLVAWVLGSCLFVSNVLFVLPAMFAERLFYVPTIGIAVLSGAGLDRMLAAPSVRPRLPRIALGAFVVAQLALAVGHAVRYRDEVAIIEATVDTVPDNARARMWLASERMASGDHAGARKQARAAVETRPDWGRPLALLATLDDLEGRPEAALVSFRKAMDRDPHDPEVANLFIQFLTKYGHDTLARAVYERHAQARGVPDPRVAVP